MACNSEPCAEHNICTTVQINVHLPNSADNIFTDYTFYYILDTFTTYITVIHCDALAIKPFCNNYAMYQINVYKLP